MAQCVFWQQRGVSATRTIGFQWISSTKIWRDCFFFFGGGSGTPFRTFFFFSLGHNLVWDPWVSFLYIWNASLPQCQANASSAGILRGESPTDFGLITFHFNVNDALFNLSIYFAMMNGFPYFPNHYMYIYILYIL